MREDVPDVDDLPSVLGKWVSDTLIPKTRSRTRLSCPDRLGDDRCYQAIDADALAFRVFR